MLQVLLLLVAVVVGSLRGIPRARADEVSLVSTGEDPAPIRGEKVTPSAPASVTSAPAKVTPPPEKVTSTDTVDEVVKKRQQTSDLFRQRLDAMEGVQTAARSGSAEDLEKARAKLADVDKRLQQSSAGVKTALDNNELVTQAAVKAEEKKVYGPDGPSLLDRTKSAIATTGGVLTGTVTGTVKGVGDMITGAGHIIAHPIDSVTNAYNALTRPAPTPEQIAATDKAALEKERSDRIAQVSQPFENGRQGGEVIGRYAIAPVLGGEAVGLAARGASTLVRGTGAAADAAPIVSTGERVGASSAADAERLRSSLAAQEIVQANRSGTALIKDDAFHRGASFVPQEQLAAGRTFALKGGDGVQRTLLQTGGELNGRSGIYEYILEPNGSVSHQVFIPEGRITGFPNQIPSRLLK